MKLLSGREKEEMMPRYNVELNGKWACFSTVSDEFITPFMDRERYDRWRKKEYGRAEYVPIEKANRMTYEEAIEAIEMRRLTDD